MAVDSHLKSCSPATRRSLVSTHLRSMNTEMFRLTDVVHAGHSRLPWHTHAEPMLVVLTGGSYTHITSGGIVECRENDVVFVPAGERHREMIGAGSARAHMILPRPGVDSKLQFVLPDTLQRFGPDDTGYVSGFLKEEIGRGEPTHALEHLAFELLANVSSLAALSSSRPPGWLEQTRSFIEQRLDEDLDLSCISAEIGISPSQLARGFRRWYGCSVWEYLCGARLEKAAGFLDDSDIPISEIALKCGFYDQSHFGNMFRRRFGTTPGLFRCRTGLSAMRRSS